METGEEASLSFESYFALGLVDSAKPGLRLYLLERGQDFCIVFFPYCLEDYEIVDLDGTDIELRLAATRHVRTKKYVCMFVYWRACVKAHNPFTKLLVTRYFCRVCLLGPCTAWNLQSRFDASLRLGMPVVER